jgi:hypothetical protein
MITLKMVIRPDRPKKDGTWPVNLRISYQRKTTYLSTPYFVTKSQINKEFEIKDKFLQLQVDDDLNRARREVSSSFEKLSSMSVSQIADHFSAFLYSKKKSGIDFFEFAKTHIEKMEANNQASRGNYGISVRKIRAFVRKDEIDFDDITLTFLESFDEWLKLTGVGARGRSLYLSNFRAIYNAATKAYNNEDEDIILLPKNPFKRFTFPTEPAPANRALSIDQLRAFIGYEPTRETVQFGQEIFLLSFFLVGMNSVDLYELPKISHGRVTYRRAKTRGVRADGAEISIKIEPEAEVIIAKYADKEKERAFNFHYRYSTAAGFNSAINEYLKVIGKAIGVEDLDFYAARHTWATLFVNECGGSESEAAFCLNHVSEHKVTAGYIKKNYSRIDRANRRVLDFLSVSI